MGRIKLVAAQPNNGDKMRIESNKLRTRKSIFPPLFSILILSGAVSAQTITVCNRSGADARVARFIYQNSSFFAMDCGGFGTEGCHSRLWNWEFIGDGYCEEFIPGNMRFIYFAVQLRDRGGDWYSTSYGKNQKILDSWDVAGWSGVSGVTMCVKDDTYGYVYDRVLRGKLAEVHNEVCRAGYSKVAVNLAANTDQDTNYTVTLPYEAPPVKKTYPNTYYADGLLTPSCGYMWASSDWPGDYSVKLKPGFVATRIGVAPAKGYRWTYGPEGGYWCSVEKIPVSKKPTSNRRNREKR